MPAGITTAIAQEKRQSAKDRREMVWIVIDEMRLNELNPSKSQCLTVAKMIVKQHPKSFADVMRDGTVIGSGYGSLLTQLKTRVEHVNCGTALTRWRKQKRVSNSPADIARGPADQYGCVRWQPDCPLGENEERSRGKWKQPTTCKDKTINASQAPSIAELKNEWPYLFTPKELYSHFKLLTDIGILDKMEQAMEEKGKLIQAGANADEVQCILVKYNREGKGDPWPCVILLLIAHRETWGTHFGGRCKCEIIMWSFWKLNWYGLVTLNSWAEGTDYVIFNVFFLCLLVVYKYFFICCKALQRQTIWGTHINSLTV